MEEATRWAVEESQLSGKIKAGSEPRGRQAECSQALKLNHGLQLPFAWPDFKHCLDQRLLLAVHCPLSDPERHDFCPAPGRPLRAESFWSHRPAGGEACALHLPVRLHILHVLGHLLCPRLRPPQDGVFAWTPEHMQPSIQLRTGPHGAEAGGTV